MRRMRPAKPRFRERSVLVRYIDPEFRGRNNRPKPPAYQISEDEEYLSVNSLELATVRQIAQVYADKFEAGQRPVALAGPRVALYNSNGIQSGVGITFNDERVCWEFNEGGVPRDAYKHHRRRNNPSHCGVEFVRVFSDHESFKFAVRMARVATYKRV